MTTSYQSDIAIVGGGFAGAAVAYHVANLSPRASITVIEPRSEIGRGLAYDSSDPSHRINVPAGRMSLLPDDEDHFSRWVNETNALRDDPAAIGADGNAYPRRSVFGDYVADLLAPLIASGRVRHVPQGATELIRLHDGWRVLTPGAIGIEARLVVIATTHPAPDIPAFAKPLLGNPLLIANPLAAGALDDIQSNERILIVGAGLTMADIVASLDHRRHSGPIVAISRHGLRARGHARERLDPFGDFQSPPPRRSVELLACIRAVVATGQAQGISWHAVLDAVREQAQTLWPSLPLPEQSRIVRHLRAYWDVHRFRIAPQIEEVIERKVAAESLQLRAGTVVALRQRRATVEALLRKRGERTSETLEVDRVVLATGPAHGRILALHPYLTALAGEGTITSDPLSLGISCDRQSRALGRDGRPIADLLIAGPLARATFGELMGLPQVSRHAVDVAKTAARLLDDFRTPVRTGNQRSAL